MISRIETGERRLDVAELWAFAKAYAKPMAYFFDPETEDHTPLSGD